jgi:hypothetical protein
MKFHGEFSSADASSLTEEASRFSLYAMSGTASVAVDSNDVVEIHQVIFDFTGATARTIQVYDGSDATVGGGEKIAETTLAQNGHSESNLNHACRPGTYPKVKTSGAGQVTVIIRGNIRQLP